MLVNLSSRFSYFLMLLITIPLCLHTQYILSLWLGKVPEYTAPFVQIMLAVGLINTLQNPTMPALHATGDLKTVQIVESLLLLSVIPIAYIFLRWTHICPVIVFCIYFIIEFITQFVRVFLVYPKVYIKRIIYIKNVLIPVTLVTIFSTVICMCLEELFKVNTFIELIAATMAYISVIVVSIFFFGINKVERNYIVNLVRSKILKNK